MAEKYNAYRSRHRRSRSISAPKKNLYSKKLKKQIIISCICLSVIYLIDSTDTYIGKNVSRGLKSALDYRINTEGMRSVIEGIIVKNKENESAGEDLNEKTKEKTVFKNL